MIASLLLVPPRALKETVDPKGLRDCQEDLGNCVSIRLQWNPICVVLKTKKTSSQELCNMKRINRKLILVILSSLACSCAPQGKTTVEIENIPPGISKNGKERLDKIDPATAAVPVEAAAEQLWMTMAKAGKLNLPLLQLLHGSQEPFAATINKKVGTGATELSANLKSVLSGYRNELILGNAKLSPLLIDYSVFSKNNGPGTATLNIDVFDYADSQRRQQEAVDMISEAMKIQVLSLAEDFAPNATQALMEQSPNTLQDLIGKSRAEKIVLLKQRLASVDLKLQGYNFSDDDQFKLIFLGAVSAVIVDALEKNPNTRTVMEKAKQVVEFYGKLQDVHQLWTAIKIAHEDMTHNMKVMEASLQRFSGDLREKIKNADLSDVTKLTPETNSELKRFAKDSLGFGKKSAALPSDDKSILSRPHELNVNLEAFVVSADKVANNFNTIIDSTEQITKTLGIRLDPQFRRALDDAKKVTSGIQLGKKVLSGFASGGYLGALSALGGADGLDALLGAGKNDVMARVQQQLGQIQEDLADIKRTQQQIIGLQKETMKMVQQVAVLVDASHREEMWLLYEISGKEDLILAKLEIANSRSLNKCESVLLTPSDSGRSFKDILNFNMGKDPRGKLHLATRERGFAACQEVINTAFSSNINESISELSISLDSQDEPTLAIFQKTKFQPLVSQILEKKLALNIPSLHLPARTLDDLQKKQNLLGFKIADARSGWEWHKNLNRLISVDRLQQIAELLLRIGPVLDLREAFLTDSSSKELTLEQTNEATDLYRSKIMSALQLVDLAIAQYSILAGEPFLTELKSEIKAISSNDYDCTPKNERWECTIKTNSLIRRNLLLAVLREKISDASARSAYIEAVESAKKTGELAALQKIIGNDLRDQLEIDEDKATGRKNVVIHWKDKNQAFISKLPSAAELEEGQILYPSQIVKLLALKNRLVNAAVEVSDSPWLQPAQLSARDKELFFRDYGI